MKKSKQYYSIIFFSIMAVLMLIWHYVIDLNIFPEWKEYSKLLRKLSTSLFAVFIILIISKVIQRYILSQKHVEGDWYNLLRITRLLSIILILTVIASFMFHNLYATAVSVGLISLILGFALQAPITSFIGWLYIVFRRPYQVGNRIQIEGKRGDVIEISYLDTIMLECNGDYVENDRLTGRIIRFPNSQVLKVEIINYDGPQVPFIWNETAIQIAYTSDIKFVEEALIQAAERDFKERHPDFFNEESAKWKSMVYFRVNTYAWLEAVISYPVEPTDTTGRRNRILKYALPILNEHPDKVQFPDGTKR